MRYHELNSAREMLRRLMYVGYVLLFVLASMTLIGSVGSDKMGLLGVTVFCCVLGWLLREFGYRHCQFSRLRNSFPHGCAADLVPAHTRCQTERLLDEFGACRHDWPRRQAIRQQLRRMTGEFPLLKTIYIHELERVLPGIEREAGESVSCPWTP